MSNEETPQPGDWRPNPGPQTRFLASSANECLYGGQAGGGKSAALIAMPLRWVEHPKFRGLILRRETPQLTDLWDKACALYSRVYPTAKPRHDERRWRFPSGATIWFTHCERETDAGRFDGHEYQLIAFDELTHFTEKQYSTICARLRGPLDLPKYARGTTNPGGPGHDWVFRRWAPWLNPESTVHANPSEKLWYMPGGDAGGWCEPGATSTDHEGHVVRARSRVFIPARLDDNPFIGDEYRAELLSITDPVRRAQLLNGDWLIKPAAGLYFKRGWFEIVDAAPVEAQRVRYWDRAATPDGDWTVGLKLARTVNKSLFIEDIVRFRGRPAEVLATIKQTAQLDGHSVAIGIEQDPGQAGVVEADLYVRELQGFNIRRVKPTGDKVTRAQPASAQAEARNIKIVRGAWNEPFLQEVELFPTKGEPDDQVDTLSGALTVLVAGLETVFQGAAYRPMFPRPRI